MFVQIPGVPSDNNLAERRLRGLVVTRKISGGSRSATGTVTHVNLASWVNTWMARGQNPFAELLALLEKAAAPAGPPPISAGV